MKSPYPEPFLSRVPDKAGGTFSNFGNFLFGFSDLDFFEMGGSSWITAVRSAKLLMAMTDRTGHTELRCLKCDKVDPMKTDAMKWADSPLASPSSNS